VTTTGRPGTVIMLSRITDPAALPAEPLITTVTLTELTVGPLVVRTDRERAARQAHVQQAEADFEPLPFDAPAARTCGRVAHRCPRPSDHGGPEARLGRE
jgi:tRNA(fMet)-specific endonuclease VapC